MTARTTPAFIQASGLARRHGAAGKAGEGQGVMARPIERAPEGKAKYLQTCKNTG